MKKIKTIVVIGIVLSIFIFLVFKAINIEKSQYYSKTNEEILNQVIENNTDEELKNIIYEETKEIDNEDTIGNLRIPKINLCLYKGSINDKNLVKKAKEGKTLKIKVK